MVDIIKLFTCSFVDIFLFIRFPCRNRSVNYEMHKDSMRQGRGPRLLTGLARAFLDRYDSGRAALLGLPVLGSKAALARVRAPVASADGSSGDARARAHA